MSRVEELIEARSNFSVKFLEFTRVSSKGKYAAFFEGEDEKYYSVRINSVRPDIKWSAINCGGKASVIELRRRVRAHEAYSSAPCMFFVDSDFDDNSSIRGFKDLYITPCYSIENLYFSLESFIRILSAEFGVNDSGEEEASYRNSIEVFEKTKSAYIDAIRPFNCLVRELRLMEKRGDLDGRLNVNNVRLESLVKIDLECVEKKYDESNPNSIFVDFKEKIVVDLSGSLRFFKDVSEDRWFRGKQNLEFLRIFLEKMKSERCSNSSRIFKNKGNVRLQTSKGNCISVLSQYADTPPCLKVFLEIQQPLSCAA